MRVTEGTLLGGRLRYAQPESGHRTGLEPVLIAAAVPARPGERVLEAGTGAGAGLMCLAARVPHLRGLGVEIDPAMAALARANFAANGMDALDVATGDIAALALRDFDHAFANPPWHDPRSTGSPLMARRRAKQAHSALLEAWIGALARALRPAGSLLLILPARQLDRAACAMREAGLGAIGRATLLPKPGRVAKLGLIIGWRGRDPAPAESQSIVLHRDDGAYTARIEAVLRDAAALGLWATAG